MGCDFQSTVLLSPAQLLSAFRDGFRAGALLLPSRIAVVLLSDRIRSGDASVCTMETLAPR